MKLTNEFSMEAKIAIAFIIAQILFKINFERKSLLEIYGEEYKEYKRKIPGRAIPKLFWN